VNIFSMSGESSPGFIVTEVIVPSAFTLKVASTL
jgi:hypothetical protein